MKKIFTYCCTPFFALAVLGGSMAMADTVYLIDYDTPAVNPNYDQGDPGLGTVFETPGAGTGGTQGAEITFADPGAGGSALFPSYFTGLNNGATSPNPATSNVPGDYIFSFDYQAVGLTASGIGGEARLTIGSNVFTQPITFTNSYQTFSSSLASLTGLTAADFSTGTQQARFALFGVDGEFGGSSTAAIRVDNIRVEQVDAVPEPSSAILFIAGSFCLLGRRSRRSLNG